MANGEQQTENRGFFSRHCIRFPLKLSASKIFNMDGFVLSSKANGKSTIHLRGAFICSIFSFITYSVIRWIWVWNSKRAGWNVAAIELEWKSIQRNDDAHEMTQTGEWKKTPRHCFTTGKKRIPFQKTEMIQLFVLKSGNFLEFASKTRFSSFIHSILMRYVKQYHINRRQPNEMWNRMATMPSATLNRLVFIRKIE